MTASVVQLSDYRARRRGTGSALVLQLGCPKCGWPARQRCRKTGTPYVRIHGPHKERIAAAERALTEGTEQDD